MVWLYLWFILRYLGWQQSPLVAQRIASCLCRLHPDLGLIRPHNLRNLLRPGRPPMTRPCPITAKFGPVYGAVSSLATLQFLITILIAKTGFCNTASWSGVVPPFLYRRFPGSIPGSRQNYQVSRYCRTFRGLNRPNLLLKEVSFLDLKAEFCQLE